MRRGIVALPSCLPRAGRRFCVLLMMAVSASCACARNYDVVVVGGSSTGVAAAEAAADAGVSVLLVEPRPYLGADLAGKLRLKVAFNHGDWPPSDKLETLLLRAYSHPPGDPAVITPLRIKQICESKLLAKRIPFRTWTYPCGIVRDADGNVAGVRLASRSGFETVGAKTLIDATEFGRLAEQAGSVLTPFKPGTVRFERNLVLDGPKRFVTRDFSCEMSDFSARGFAAAEQAARDATWETNTLDSADSLLLRENRSVVKDAPYVWTVGLVSASTDASKAIAAGRAAGDAAARAAVSRQMKSTSPKIDEIPVIATCDVFVAGAGTGGAPATIAAARAGMRTIVCDPLYRMGGLMTDGVIDSYCFGLRIGFTPEIDAGVAALRADVHGIGKAEWFRRAAREAGAEIWFGALAVGLEKDGERVSSVIVAFADGTLGKVNVRCAIDATGNADLAALAGEETEFIDGRELSLQGAGSTAKLLGRNCLNTDSGFVDDTDAEDLMNFTLRVRQSIGDYAWDQSQIVNSRERRRMHGVAYVTPQDVILRRTYPDVFARTYSNFDTHGQTVGEQFFVEAPHAENPITVNLPYRCILPKRTDGLLVIGLGMSAHRDAMPILRMQPDVQNQGFAAGTAAAMAVRAGVAPRAIDVKALQRKLIDKGILDESVLTMKDSFPLSDDVLAKAAETVDDGYKGLAELLSDSKRAVPLLKRKSGLPSAHLLALMGDGFRAAQLAKAVAEKPWDKGWNFRGMDQFGRSVSWVDSYLIALGRAKASCAVGPLRQRAEQLKGTDEYSHFRAVALCAEGLGDKSLVPVLAHLLTLPGVGGHSLRPIAEAGVVPIPEYAHWQYGNRGMADKERNDCLRELCVARALFNLGDDVEKLGERTLRAYAADPRRAYANHAGKVLKSRRTDGMTAPDDSGLFPFVIRPDAEGTALDMSALLPAPAGRDGFLRRDGEHFVDARGKIVRLNGVNLTGGANFPAHAEADRLAAQFARLGFNCVRFHLFDQFAYANCFQDSQPCLFRRDPSSGRATVVDEEMRDRFEYMIAALGRRGVYVNVNLHAGHQFGPADGVRKTNWANRGVDMFDRKIIDLDKAFFRDLLRHVNPYTGRPLAEDPSVALMEINNENALMQVWWSKTVEKQGGDPGYLADFHRLREASGYNATTNGINKFIIETEKAYFREMCAFLRNELGVKCPVYGTQLDYTAPWVMSDTCDAIDCHIYWTHPSWTNPPGTDGRQGCTAGVPWQFVNKPMVVAGLTGGWDMEHIIAGRGCRRVAGLPFITSECAAPYPNWYGAEYQPTIHAYAAFQDWAGVFVYSWNNERDNAFPDHNPFFFSHAARPDCVAHFPAACAMFLRGDVATAKRRVDVAVDRSSRFAMAQKNNLPLVVADPESGSNGRVTNDVFLRHAVGVDLRESLVSEQETVACMTNGTILSDTDEIVLHRADGREGWFSVNTPNVRFLTGYLDGRRHDLGGVVFAPGKTKLGWCAISLVSQKGDGLRPGARLLLAVTGYTHNGGAVFRHKGGDVWGGTTEDFGTGKVVTEGVPLAVTLPVAAAECWALDESGARKVSVPTTSCNGHVDIAVGPVYRTVWYEITL